MGERVDLGDFSGEGRIRKVPKRKTFTFSQCAYRCRVSSEVQWRRPGLCHLPASFFLSGAGRQLLDPRPGELRWSGLAVLPPVDRGERNTGQLCKLRLGQPQTPTQTLDAFRVVLRERF